MPDKCSTESWSVSHKDCSVYSRAQNYNGGIMVEFSSVQSRKRITHGAHRVAAASFGTVMLVCVVLLIAVILLGEQEQSSIIALIVVSLVGSAAGYLAWRNAFYRLATTMGSAGLLSAGLFTLVLSNTMGNATGILLLASVITAGGLLGWRAAVYDMIAVLVVVAIGWFWGPEIRLMLSIPLEGVQPSEFLVSLFVLTSVPCWGAYVVAIDASNRQAWQSEAASNTLLLQANAELEAKRQALARAVAEQETLTRLGLLANGTASLEDLEQACRDAQREDEGPSEVFLQGLEQVLATRRVRMRILDERAQLASRIQREQRLEALMRMAGGVAHDFNNALAVITAVAEALLKEETLSESLRQEVRIILQTVIHARGVTLGLVTFAKGLPRQNRSCAPGSLLQSMAPVLRRTLRGRAALDLPNSLPDTHVSMPADAMERVLINLVRNAASSMQKEDGTVSIHLKNLGTGALSMQVRDDGHGMNTSTIEHAIEPYFSTWNGSGMGLAIVHGLIEQAGGRLHIDAKPDLGTTISIELPIRSPALTSRRHPTQAVASPAQRNILLIDDDVMVREAVAGMLEMQGWSVQEASQQQEAVDAFAAQKPDLIVCDLRLQNESGFDVTAELRARGATAPILFITGYMEQSQDILEDDYQVLVKPFTMKELRAAIQSLHTNASE